MCTTAHTFLNWCIGTTVADLYLPVKGIPSKIHDAVESDELVLRDCNLPSKKDLDRIGLLEAVKVFNLIEEEENEGGRPEALEKELLGDPSLVCGHVQRNRD